MIQLISANRLQQIYNYYLNSGDTLNAATMQNRIKNGSIIPVDDNGNQVRLSL